MSKIDDNLTKAIQNISANFNPNVKNPRCFLGKTWSQGTTTVTGGVENGFPILEVRLHGNLIAVIRPARLEVEITNAGFATNVTHARIRAILSAIDKDMIKVKKDGDDTLFYAQSFSVTELGRNRLICYANYDLYAA